MNYDYGFDTEFMNDDEVEAMLENIVSEVANQASNEDNRTAIVNPYRMCQIAYTYKVIKYLTRGTKAKVTCELHKPYKSMGSVSVVGANLTFRNTEWFMKAVEFASNFEAYPKTDGTIQMNFTFHGLTQPID